LRPSPQPMRPLEKIRKKRKLKNFCARLKE
jgi:hypothetical protein